MNGDSDVTMAINSKFNSILHEIQLSNLNFIINMTPYAAYITLKKTTLINNEGVPSMPSPPILKLLEQNLREKSNADLEISRLRDTLAKYEDNCTRLAQENKTLCDALLTSKEENEAYRTRLEFAQKEVIRLSADNKKLEVEISSNEKKHVQFEFDSGQEISLFKKTIKSKEKEIHNMNTKLKNCHDTISNMKNEISSIRG